MNYLKFMVRFSTLINPVILETKVLARLKVHIFFKIWNPLLFQKLKTKYAKHVNLI